MEIYYVSLNPAFLNFVKNDFQTICDIFLSEYETIVIGVASENQTKVMFNPTSKDMKVEYENWSDFFATYNVAVVLADNNLDAETIGNAINMPDAFDGILARVIATVSLDSKDKDRPYVTRYKNKDKKKEMKTASRRRQSILNATVKFANRSTSMLRGSLLFCSYSKKDVAPLSGSDDEDSDDKEDSSDFESDDDDDESYVGFTQAIRQQRQTQRMTLAMSGNPKARLPGKVYVDTNKSLRAYSPGLISHAKGESKNPLAHLKLGELMSTSHAAGEKLHANTCEVDPTVRANARRRSSVRLKAVVSIVKMSRLLKAKDTDRDTDAAVVVPAPDSVGLASGSVETGRRPSSQLSGVTEEEDDDDDDDADDGEEKEETNTSSFKGSASIAAGLSLLKDKGETKEEPTADEATGGVTDNEQDLTREEKEEKEKEETGGGEVEVEVMKGPGALFLQNLRKRTASHAVAPEPQPHAKGVAGVANTTGEKRSRALCCTDVLCCAVLCSAVL
jgi:hypothetical protein